MTDQELKDLREWAAEKVMGWELFRLGYYGTEEETPRQTEIEPWLDKMGFETVGNYYLNLESNFGIFTGDWFPDTDLNQTFMVVEKMRELGWYLYIEPEPNYTFPGMAGYDIHSIIYEIGFYHPIRQKTQQVPNRGLVMVEKVTALAILLAARKALSSNSQDSKP